MNCDFIDLKQETINYKGVNTQFIDLKQETINYKGVNLGNFSIFFSCI